LEDSSEVIKSRTVTSCCSSSCSLPWSKVATEDCGHHGIC